MLRVSAARLRTHPGRIRRDYDFYSAVTKNFITVDVLLLALPYLQWPNCSGQTRNAVATMIEFWVVTAMVYVKSRPRRSPRIVDRLDLVLRKRAAAVRSGTRPPNRRGAVDRLATSKADRTRIYQPGPNPPEQTSGTVLTGVASRYTLIDTAEQECVAGVAFRPGGTTSFFGLPACEMRDTVIPLEFLWGRSRAVELRQRLLEAPHRRRPVRHAGSARCWMPGTPPGCTRP